MFSPGELYMPDRELRIFPFLRLLQWPSDDELTERTANGKFLAKLGMKVLPPLVPLLKYVSDKVSDDELRVQCLQFVSINDHVLRYNELVYNTQFITLYCHVGTTDKGQTVAKFCC